MAFIVPKGGVDEDALKADLVARVEDEFPKWWAPDEVVFIDEVPKTATGKFDKKVLRDRYDDSSLIEGKTPDSEAPSDE